MKILNKGIQLWCSLNVFLSQDAQNNNNNDGSSSKSIESKMGALRLDPPSK